MAGFVEVARVQDVPPGTVLVVEVGGRQRAVANVEGGFFAVDNGARIGAGRWGTDRSTPSGASGRSSACCTAASSTSAPERCSTPAAVGVGTYSVEVDGGVVRVSVD